MATTHRRSDEIYYPEEDGKVSESAKHYQQGHDLYGALHRFYAGRTDVFIAANIFLYYQQGDPRKSVSPDLLIALGVRPRPIEERGSYRLWEEGVVPQMVLELTSASMRQVDIIQKPRRYAALGVREYFLFDPLNEFLQPQLQGYRLNAQAAYERLPGEELDSEVLGLRLVVQAGWLRLLHPATGALLPTDEELKAALEETEAENTRLRAELERLRGAP